MIDMGRNALSDEEKKRRGTFREGQSDSARRTAAVSNVLAFPVEPSIPKCRLPLPADSIGHSVYNDWCQRLFSAGLLTKVSLAIVENLVLVEDKIDRALRAGKPVASRDMIVRQSVITKLELLNVDQNLVAGQTKKGVFGKNGFPTRLRVPASHRARRSK